MGVGLLFYIGIQEGLEEKVTCESRPEKGVSGQAALSKLTSNPQIIVA